MKLTTVLLLIGTATLVIVRPNAANATDPATCYAFAPTPIACGGCVSTNNCGMCKTGACDAFLCSRCSAGKVATPVECGGNLLGTPETVPCFVNFYCDKPTPCEGNKCDCGSRVAGTSEETVQIPTAGDLCTPCP